MGTGPWSETVEQKPVGQPSPPVLDRVTGGNRTLTLGWHRPTDTQGDDFSDYTWCYIPSDAPRRYGIDWTCGSYLGFSPFMDPAYATYKITGLTNNVQYDVRVFWMGGYGRTADSNILTGTPRKTPVPPAAPAIGTLTPGDGALTVTWTAPADNGGASISAYDLRYIPSDAPDKADANWSEEQDVGAPGSLEHTITGLTNGAGYDVQVRAVNAAGYGEWSTTEESSPNTPATGAPTISGTAHVGETLTADVSGIDDADGRDTAVFSYQWVREDIGTDTDIQGETASTYTLADADVGKAVKVRVSFTDDAGNPETLTSAATAVVAARPNSPATGEPTISGTTQVGETLTADVSDIDDADGRDNATFNYQWQANDSDIPGATDSTYTLVADYVGKTVKVKVSFTDDAGNPETLTSGATDAVAEWPADPLTATLENTPESHDGEDPFAFELRFSEEFGLSYVTLRDDHAFTVTGGTVTRARRLERPSNIRWEIHVQPDSVSDVTVVLPITEDCNHQGAICTEDGEQLSNRLELTVPGPQSSDQNTPAPDAPGNISVSPGESGELVVTWQAPSGDGGSAVTGYRVQWKESAASWDTPADVSEAAVIGTTHTITGLSDGMEYAVRVIATNEVGDSPPSGEQTGTTKETETVPPEQYGFLYVDGATLRVNYNEALDEDSVPAADAFALKVALKGGPIAWHDERARREVDSVSVTGSSVVLILAEAVTANDNVALSYTPPSDDAAPRIRDVAGNAAVGFRPMEVTNDTEEAPEDRESSPNTPATGQPTIGGTVQVGETLTADVSDIDDQDGLENAAFSYQWLADDSDIPGANDSNYTLVSADVGKTIKVRVSFTDAAGNPESLTSDATVAVAARPNTPATGLPTISGTTQVGDTLTADTSSIDDQDDLDNATFRYQWLADDSDIPGATDSTYTLVSADEGKTVKVRVSFTDDAGNEETLTSAATETVAVKPNTPATGRPTIGRAAQVGETLTADTSDIDDADGLENAVFSYQWVREDLTGKTDIQGETASTYTPTDADEGKVVRVRVSFTDDKGNEETLTSVTTGRVKAAPIDQGNTPDEATVIDVGFWMYQRGEITPHEDVDYFRIDVAAEHAGYIRIAWNETIRPFAYNPYARFALFNSDGTCVTRECEHWGGATDASLLSLTEGTYYLRVSGPPSLSGIIDRNPEETRHYTVGWETLDSLTRLYDECAAKQDQFTDPLYGCQNSLNNRDHPGEDINVESAWQFGALGQGVNVVITDTGIDDLHEDLVGAVDTGRSTTVTGNGLLWSPEFKHGTYMAGIIAAQHNAVGVRGVAPNASVSHFRFAQGRYSAWVSGKQMRLAMTHNYQETAVSSNSWGYDTWAGEFHSMSKPMANGIEQGISQGFYGKGTSYVFSAANHFNSNLSEIENHRAVITVCGVDETGQAMEPYNTIRYYGYGSSLWVCAPYDTWTTAHNNIYLPAEGTSVSTAIVSGVVALVRGVNPALTWRDVKVILAGSARQNDASHPQWTTGARQYGSYDKNYHYNEYYGFGVVDAGAAVELATTWNNLPAMKTVSAQSDRLYMTAPDPVDGSSPATLSDTLNLDPDVGFVEFVELNIEFDHPSLRDLSAELESPTGTIAMLLEPDEIFRGINFNGNHRFGSAKSLGEDPTGTWLDFTHFRRHERGNLRVDDTERPGVPEHQYRLRTVKNLPRPATGGAAPERGRPSLFLNFA